MNEIDLALQGLCLKTRPNLGQNIMRVTPDVKTSILNECQISQTLLVTKDKCGIAII